MCEKSEICQNNSRTNWNEECKNGWRRGGGKAAMAGKMATTNTHTNTFVGKKSMNEGDEEEKEEEPAGKYRRKRCTDRAVSLIKERTSGEEGREWVSEWFVWILSDWQPPGDASECVSGGVSVDVSASLSLSFYRSSSCDSAVQATLKSKRRRKESGWGLAAAPGDQWWPKSFGLLQSVNASIRLTFTNSKVKVQWFLLRRFLGHDSSSSSVQFEMCASLSGCLTKCKSSRNGKSSLHTCPEQLPCCHLRDVS